MWKRKGRRFLLYSCRKNRSQHHHNQRRHDKSIDHEGRYSKSRREYQEEECRSNGREEARDQSYHRNANFDQERCDNRRKRNHWQDNLHREQIKMKQSKRRKENKWKRLRKKRRKGSRADLKRNRKKRKKRRRWRSLHRDGRHRRDNCCYIDLQSTSKIKHKRRKIEIIKNGEWREEENYEI